MKHFLELLGIIGGAGAILLIPIIIFVYFLLKGIIEVVFGDYYQNNP